MPQAKDGTLIIRVPLRLKQKIEDIAKEKDISASEYVRKLIEESVFKREMEIEEQVNFIEGINKHIDGLLKESAVELGSTKVETYTKEIREYKKLLYTHQVKAIKLLSEEISIADAETKALKDDIKFIHLFNENLYKLTSSEEPHNRFLDGFSIVSEKEAEKKVSHFQELTWEKTDTLYCIMIMKYREHKMDQEEN